MRGLIKRMKEKCKHELEQIDQSNQEEFKCKKCGERYILGLRRTNEVRASALSTD